MSETGSDFAQRAHAEAIAAYQAWRDSQQRGNPKQGSDHRRKRAASPALVVT